jgi:tRNA uridine 5-carboxymethylaminomethyl modification enzyme
MKRLEERLIPRGFDYARVVGLRNEAREKLMRFHPINVGQASRIHGVNPADISILLIHLERATRQGGEVTVSPLSSPSPKVTKTR